MCFAWVHGVHTVHTVHTPRSVAAQWICVYPSVYPLPKSGWVHGYTPPELLRRGRRRLQQKIDEVGEGATLLISALLQTLMQPPTHRGGYPLGLTPPEFRTRCCVGLERHSCVGITHHLVNSEVVTGSAAGPARPHPFRFRITAGTSPPPDQAAGKSERGTGKHPQIRQSDCQPVSHQRWRSPTD